MVFGDYISQQLAWILFSSIKANLCLGWNRHFLSQAPRMLWNTHNAYHFLPLIRIIYVAVLSLFLDFELLEGKIHFYYISVSPASLGEWIVCGNHPCLWHERWHVGYSHSDRKSHCSKTKLHALREFRTYRILGGLSVDMRVKWTHTHPYIILQYLLV